jgi:hypothetical protein
MADLKDIQYTHIDAGTRPVDYSLELRATENLINGGISLIDDRIKAGVAQDMQDVITDVVSETQELDAFAAGPQYSSGSPEGMLQRKVDKLTAQMAGGNVSQQGKAQMMIKQVLTEAQARYPWLVDDLQRRAGQVVAGSAQLDALAISDAQRKQDAKNAQSQYDAMVELGRKRVSEGGLGINPILIEGSAAWVKEFERKSRWYNNRESHAAMVEMALSEGQAVLNDPVKVDLLVEDLVGEDSSVRQAVDMIVNQDNGLDLFFAEINKPGGGNQLLIQQMMETSIPLMVPQLQQYGRELKVALEEFMPAGVENHPQGQRLLAAKEASLGYVTMMTDLVTAVQEAQPGAVEKLKLTYAAYNQMAFDNLPDNLKPVASMFTSPIYEGVMQAGEFGGAAGQGAVMNLLSGLPVPVLAESMWPDTFRTDQRTGFLTLALPQSDPALGIDGSATATEREEATRRRFTGDGPSHGVNAKNRNEKLSVSYATSEGYLRAWTGAPNQDTALADYTLNGLLGEYMYYNLDGQYPANTSNRMVEMLASPSIEEMVDEANKGGTANAGVRRAWASQATSFYANAYKPGRVKQKAEAKFHTEYVLGQFVLSDLVTMDGQAAVDGEFKWSLNMQEAKRVLATQPPVGSGNISTDQAVRALEDKVFEEMATLEDLVQQDIQIERMLNKARSVDGKTFPRTDSWYTFFSGAGSTDPMNSWNNIFFPGGPQ